jgi:type IV pilus assembly protein PilB
MNPLRDRLDKPRSDLEQALARHSPGVVFLHPPTGDADRPLGQLLLSAMLVDQQQLDQALALQAQLRRQRSSYQRLGELLINQGIVGGQRVNSLLARKFGIPSVRLADCQVPVEVLARVPAQLVLQYQILPLALVGQRLLVASESPWDNEGVTLLRFHTGLQIELVMASGEDISVALGRYFSHCDEDEALQDAGHQRALNLSHGTDVKILEQQANQRPIVRLLNTIIMQGLLRGASDIHIRPTEQAIEVFYRLDGRLHRVRSLASDLLAPLVSRAKVIARLNIAERRLPQDGHARFHRDTHQTDLRLSVIPTIHGESVVIRLLDPLTGVKRLADLGLPEDQYLALQGLARQRSGLILVVGPTGAGKSTTLYALLDEIRRDGRHILSVEDPVEYQIDGIEQVQVNERKGLAFSNVLRHFLRHDPDVIMVGEIRDQATAELAVRAALTGHLVLSTLHTSDAPATVTRLLNMGIEPYLLSATLLAVMAQGLIRVNCTSCCTRHPVDAALLQRLGVTLDSPASLLKGRGCPACFHSGYKGRRVVSELMCVDEAMALLINRQTSLPQLRQHALDHGMKPMADQAWSLVQEGRSTIDELLGLSNEY